MEAQQDHMHSAASADASAEIYGEDGVILASFLAHIGAAIADRDTLTLKRDVAGLHQSELGDLLEALLPEQRLALVELMGSDFDFSALTEVDEAIRLDIVDNLPNEQIAQAVQELDSDDAVYILEDLDAEDQNEILAQLPFTERIRLRRSLDYPEESAGRRMQTGIRRGAAVLDHRPDHRLSARRQGPAGAFQPGVRHRSDLQAAWRGRPRPDPAHQAGGEDRRDHA